MNHIARGQIYIADLDPPHPKHKKEPTKVRPVVVASIEQFNKSSATVIVFPISASASPADETIVFIKADNRNNLSSDGGIMPLHVRGIIKERLKKPVGLVSPQQLERALSILNLAIGQ